MRQFEMVKEKEPVNTKGKPAYDNFWFGLEPELQAYKVGTA
jgi:hypothetical protein